MLYPVLYTCLNFAQAEENSGSEVIGSNQNSDLKEMDLKDTDLSALEAKLLGPQEMVPTSQPMMIEPEVPVWMFPVFVAMVVLVVWFKTRQGKTSTPGDIRLRSKIPLGREGSLAVVDVTMSNGQTRPMLMGLSGNSAPRLLTFLDDAHTFLGDDPRDLQENFHDLERAMQPATYTATHYNANAQVKTASVEDVDDNFDQFLRKMSQNQDGQSSNNLELENRNDLVNEILQERGLDQQESEMDLGFGLTVTKEPEEDPWVVGFQKRYKQKSQM